MSIVDDNHAVPDGMPGLNVPALHPIVTQVSGIALCAGLTLGLGRWLTLPIMKFFDEDFLVESDPIMVGVKVISLFAFPAAAMLAFYLDGYRRGKLQSIPIGSHGAPLFLRNRLTIFGHVLGEGDHWIPRGFNQQPVDTRKRPFIRTLRENRVLGAEEAEDDRGEMFIAASAKSSLPEDASAANLAQNIQHVPTLMLVKISGTVQVVNEDLYLSSDEPWLILKNELEGKVRAFVRTKNPIELTTLKASLTDHVLDEMRKIGALYGIYFHSLPVTDIRFPEKVEEAAANYLIEQAQRDAETYQAETFDQVAKKMKATFPNLSDVELRNAVFAAAKMAQITVNSVEGRGNIPLMLTPNTPTTTT